MNGLGVPWMEKSYGCPMSNFQRSGGGRETLCSSRLKMAETDRLLPEMPPMSYSTSVNGSSATSDGRSSSSGASEVNAFDLP